MKLLAKLPIVVFLSLVFCGCTAEQAFERSEDNPHLEQGRVQFINARTKYTIQVAKVDAERVNGGLLKIYLTVRNTAKENVWADIRTTFLDEKNHVLEQTNWEPTFFEARTVGEYTCTSMSSKAVDYQILVKLPDKSSQGLQ